VIVTVAVPVVAVLLAENVSVELPLPGVAIDVGLKLAVTPVGNPDTDKVTAELKPPLTVVEIVVLPEVPCVTLSEAGEAATVKSGVATFHTSAIVLAVAALPTRVKPYRSSSVRRTLKWLIVSVN